MSQKLSLEQIINKSVLPKLVTLLVLVSLIALGASYLAFQNSISEKHFDNLNTFKGSTEEKIALLKAEVSNLSKNELIANSLIDFEARFEYLPIFFQSLRLSTAENASIILTDFQGEAIISNNEEVWQNADSDIAWKQTVLENGASIFDVSSAGVLLVYPVFYADLPEGALIVYLPSLSGIFKSEVTGSKGDIEFSIRDLNDQLLYHSGSMGATDYADNSTFYSVSVTSDDLALKFFTQQPLYAAYKELLTLAALITLTVAIVFFGSVYSNRLATQIATGSIGQLRKSIESVDSDDQTISILEGDPAEVEALKIAYNSLSTELSTTTQSLSEFEGVINSLNEFLVVVDDDLKHIVCNEAFKDFVDNIQINERESLDVDGIIAQVLPASLVEQNYKLETTPEEKVYRSGKDIGFKIINWRRQEFVSDSNHSKGWVFVGSDVTLTKAIQADLEMKNKAIDEAKTSICISKFKPGSPITYVNDAFTQMTGFEKEDSIGRNCSFLQGPDTEPDKVREISAAIKNKQSLTITLLNYKKDGTPFYNELTLSPIKNELGEVTHVLGLQVDVSEAERVKQHLSEAKQKAEESNELKSSFLASMSHEIRTPLNGVIGMLNILSESELDDSQKRHTEIAQSSAKSLLAIINDILDLSKIEAGKVELEYRKVNVVDLISEVAKPLSKLATDKMNEIIIDISELDSHEMTIDEARVRQILLNLLSNALKFTKAGDVSITAKIVKADAPLQTARAEDCWLECSIADTGIGIPRNRLDSIFDSFTQADSSTTRKFGGTGLGLAICKQLCEAMGGHIRVESIEGKGSRFVFTIQLRDRFSDLSPAPAPSIPDQRILILHSHKAVTDALAKQLNKLNLDTVCCSDRSAAKTMLADQHYDILFCDLGALTLEAPKASYQELIHIFTSDSQNSELKTVLITPLGIEHTLSTERTSAQIQQIESPVVYKDLLTTLLPIDHPDQSTLSQAKHATAESTSNLVHIRNYPVLLVEDNPVNQLVAKTMLSKLSIDVHVAENGEDAIQKLKANAKLPKAKHFVAVFMDCQMPVMDGYEATRRIRLGDAGQAYVDIPIIAMTANAIKGDREACIEVGMNDYVSKPIEATALNSAVEHWVTGVTPKSAP